MVAFVIAYAIAYYRSQGDGTELLENASAAKDGILKDRAAVFGFCMTCLLIGVFRPQPIDVGGDVA